jgi:hypothetical protein
VLYGTTQAARPDGCGTVFSLTPTSASGPWTETILYTFPIAGGRGCDPSIELTVAPNGALYSNARIGGPADAGVVFGLKP